VAIVVFGEVIDDARDAGVQVAAAEFLGRDNLADSSPSPGAVRREDGALPAQMTVSSTHRGEYAPPAVQDPMTEAKSARFRSADIAPGWRRCGRNALHKGTTSSCIW